MNQVSLSTIVFSPDGERLFSFERAALLTQTSVVTIEKLVYLGAIEPVGAMLRLQDIGRIGRIARLQADLELNLAGAAIALDMAEEIAQLKAQLQACRAFMHLR